MSTRKNTKLDLVTARSGGRSGKVRESVMQALQSILLDKGYAGVTHRAVANAAGVDHVTVYRRWPTRARLVADMFLELVDTFVPVPDTGNLRDDFELYLSGIVAALQDTNLRQLIQALFMASMEGDASVRAATSEIWRERFKRSYTMLDRAIERGDIPAGIDRERVIEALVAPAWFRSFVTGLEVGSALMAQTAADAVKLAKMSEG